MEETELEFAIMKATRGAMRQRVDGSLCVSVEIPPKDALQFMRFFPEVDLPIFIAREDPRSAKVGLQQDIQAGAKRSFGQYAKLLRLHGDWMRNPSVWAQFGSDVEFLEWCRDQKCAHCGIEPHYEMDVFVRSEPAHVRRVANGAGVAEKPPFSAIPLCSKHHRLQHQSGEDALAGAGMGKDWFDKKRIQCVQEWLWECMRFLFEVESMSEVPWQAVLSKAKEYGIEKYLPECYRTGVLPS